MASAYPAVISLKRNIERLIHHTNPEITESAYEELELLSDVIKSLDEDRNRSINESVINALDRELREAVWKVEDVFESYALCHSLPSLGDMQIDENGVEQEVKSFLKKVKELKEEYIIKLLDYSLLTEDDDDDDVVSTADDFGGKKSTTVGLWDELEEIIDVVVDAESQLRIVSLVGMAGIGKTKLAREIYQHPIIAENFDFTAWVRVGPRDENKNVLGDIVTQIEGRPRNSLSKHLENDVVILSKLLENSLYGRRYLIVLDDIWSTDVCKSLESYLPEDGEGGRLLVTTRLEGVAESLDSSIHQMRFLSNEESWNLLWRNVFDDNSFPPQLEKAGRKIAENCEGLPLLILAVADILCGLQKTQDYWNKVAHKKTTTFTDAYDQISKVLSTSYHYLPQYLKPCYLYMGVFPQSCEIHVPKLIHLWDVEDFLEPAEPFRTLQDFAMQCLEKLVSDSLALVCDHSSNFRIKSIKLHSAYWYLCVKEARRNKFFHVLNKLTDCSSIETHRRFSVQNNILLGIKEVRDSMAAASTARSILCTGKDHEYPVPICLNLMLLKVLDALAIRFYEFPTEVVKLLRLRYLALTHYGKLPCSISNLQQLHCLTVRQHHNIKLVRDLDSTRFPEEVWDMQELRHLRIMGSNLPDPTDGANLPNLLTLDVNAHSCTEDVFRSIPNLRKLGIKIEQRPDTAETLNCFEHIRVVDRLESLKCVVVNPPQVVAPPHHLSNLPRGLEKLSLNGLGYSWKYMSLIGSLPYLRVLKLRCCAFQGPEWEIKVGEFRRLKFLLLEDIDVVQLTISDKRCFRSLQRLIIRHCYKLKRIPWQIGAIPYLKTMEIVDCSHSVVDSALQIQENRRKYAWLQLVINSSWN